MDASPNHSHPQVEIEHAYAAVIREARSKPFVWGSHDCMLFAADVVRARTGRDVLAELGITPTWTTAREGVNATEANGGFRSMWGRLFGEPVGILQARVGDVCLVNDPENDGRELMAVVHAGVLLAPAANGLCALPKSTAVAAWRVK